MAPSSKSSKQVATLTHSDARRSNIPTAEYESVMADEEKQPIQVAYERRNRDLDPQLVWRGKDEQDWSDLVAPAPPLYIQEKVHPKVLIDDLLRQSKQRSDSDQPQLSLFADFNGLPDTAAATEFYRHEANWTNRLILGDSLQVMASLTEREGLRGKVQCIFIDPPYGIKFNSNFQWSTTSRDVKDGNKEHITREPEQVKAFRDTWRDGIHSYLTYLRDRLTVARDLLSDSGSIFIQIGDENVHRVRALMDEVFGEDNHVAEIKFRTTSNRTAEFLPSIFDTILYYAKSKDNCKFRRMFGSKSYSDVTEDSYGCIEIDFFAWRRLSRDEKNNPLQTKTKGPLFGLADLTSSHEYIRNIFSWNGKEFTPKKRYWSTSLGGLQRLGRANRLCDVNGTLRYKRYFEDTSVTWLSNIWSDTGSGSQTEDRTYVVQTLVKVIERCILMTTDPGDLVIDPTCGSGTTAYVAEQWGRRWITIDTSRVALALARARIMGARYPYYLLADSQAGQRKEAEIARTVPSNASTYGSIRHGFVYERVPHITLKSIANNAEIDVIWERYQETLEALRQQLNTAVGKQWQEWEIPREAVATWSPGTNEIHAAWWQARIARQKEIDASIDAKADQEFLYDKPYEDKSTVRVAGPFTVESLSPHRILVVDEDDELQEPGKFVAETKSPYGDEQDFTTMILDNLKTAGVQQAHKEDRITFTALTGWPGRYICAEGRYLEGENGKERRAGIFIGPEFGTVARPDLVAAAREAGDAGFDVLIACAFNYDAHSAEFEKLGRVPVLKARMNADLHMTDTLKNTGKGNLFVIFGEPDLDIASVENNQIQVKIHGVDIFHPQSGEVRSSGPDGIACWFIDTAYNEESFFVRHAYFLGADDPYKSLKTTLKAEIDEEAWKSLYSDVSRPFDKPQTGRIAVKVINHLGDEVMKVFNVIVTALRIADTFQDSLMRLTGLEQNAVKMIVLDLQLNLNHPRQQFHRLVSVGDPNFWSVHISSDVQLIIHKTDDNLLLCYVDHHDAAYNWAVRRKIEHHPRTGAAQLVEVRKRVENIPIVKHMDVEPPQTAKPPRLVHVSADALLDYGVPPEWIEDVRRADDDALLDLPEHLPQEAAEAVWTLAIGGTPKISLPLASDTDPFKHPDAQRRFRMLTNVEELERALEYPWEKWTVFLHPAQRHLVERAYNGPARVAGSAGTGKTVVALHRAVFLARQHPDANILLGTFSNALANALNIKLRRLIGNEATVRDRIQIYSMKDLGSDLYTDAYGPPDIASPELLRSLLMEVATATPGHHFSEQFLIEEWTDVVDAWQLDSWERYRDVPRLGRKTRIGGKQREMLWSIFQQVLARLAATNRVTWPMVYRRVTEQLAIHAERPFDFAVVDEAQDLSVAELRLLAVLGNRHSDSLYFAGDLGQRIFQQPFSWKSVGVDVRGRSHTLNINYRTSHQIRQQADRLLPRSVADVDGNVEERRGTISVFNGLPPTVEVCEGADAEAVVVSQWLAERLSDGMRPEEIGVFVRAEAQLQRAREAVRLAGAASAQLDDQVAPARDCIAISTMHLAKGLEFRAVAVMACDDEVIPLQSRIETVADESDLEEVYTTERHLLYVACTRARDHLLVTGVEPASEFLDDLQKEEHR